MDQKSEVFDSVWDALEESPEEAENMKIRSSLLIALREHLDKLDLTQAKAAEMLGVKQPRISDLYRGKVNRFGVDALITLASKAGLRVELNILEVA
jgi:predicted XRE-type DNA-binding protein